MFSVTYGRSVVFVGYKKTGRPQGNLFHQPDIRLKNTPKNNLIDVPEKAISSFTEASKKNNGTQSVVKI